MSRGGEVEEEREADEIKSGEARHGCPVIWSEPSRISTGNNSSNLGNNSSNPPVE